MTEGSNLFRATPSTGRLAAELKEWKKLGGSVKSQFKKKLDERLENPRVPVDKLSGYESVYKIKLRSAGYRLVYEVIDNELVVFILVVGKREKGKVYENLKIEYRYKFEEMQNKSLQFVGYSEI